MVTDAAAGHDVMRVDDDFTRATRRMATDAADRTP
jgi:hypothetical protein